MALSVNELIKSFDKIPPEPVVLFAPGRAPFGREDFEPFLVERALEKIVAATVDPSLHDMALTVYHADETQPGDIVLEARTFPFLAERRLVVVRNAERYNAMSGEKNPPLAPLVEYIENPAEFTRLVLIASALDKRKRFFKACEKHAQIIECPQLDEPQLKQWVREEARQKGKKIGEEAVLELLDRAGNRLSDVNNALMLALNFSGDRDTVAADDVRSACADVAEETVWALTDAIAGKKVNVALHALHQLLAMNKSHDEILGTVNWLVENAYRSLPETGADIPKPFVAKKVLPMAQNLGLEAVVRAMSLCTQTNFLMRSTGVDRNLALEMLVIKLASHPGKPARRQ